MSRRVRRSDIMIDDISHNVDPEMYQEGYDEGVEDAHFDIDNEVESAELRNRYDSYETGYNDGYDDTYFDEIDDVEEKPSLIRRFLDSMPDFP